MSGPAPRWTLCLLTLPSACIEKPLIESMPEIGFSVVSTGRDHACGLAETAEIYCWSRTNPRPTLVSNDVSFTTVATFWDHTCGIALDGAAYCWGLSSVGQLGAAVEDLETCGVAAGGTAPCSRDRKSVV